MVTEDAVLTVSLWERELRANAIKVVARSRGSFEWGLPFLVQPQSWPAFYREARRRRSEVEYAVDRGGTLVSVL